MMPSAAVASPALASLPRSAHHSDASIGSLSVLREQEISRHAWRWVSPSACNALTASSRAEGPSRFLRSGSSSRETQAFAER